VGLPITGHMEGIRPLLGFCECTSMNLGSRTTSAFIIQRDRGPLPINKEAPPIRATVDRWRKNRTWYDESMMSPRLRSTQQRLASSKC
jgi:hypothetical protein